jgi:hypothetical protein
MTWGQLREFWRDDVRWHIDYLRRSAINSCMNRNYWIRQYRGRWCLTRLGADFVDPELPLVHKFEEDVVKKVSKHFRMRLCWVFARASQQASAIPLKKRAELPTLTIIPCGGFDISHSFATEVVRRPSECVERFTTNRAHELPTLVVPVFTDAELIKDLLRRNGAHVVSSYENFEYPNQVAIDPSFGLQRLRTVQAIVLPASGVPGGNAGRERALAAKYGGKVQPYRLPSNVRAPCQGLTEDGSRCVNPAKWEVELESGKRLLCGQHVRPWWSVWENYGKFLQTR